MESKEIQSCIRENPGQAIVMSVSIGVVLAQLPLRLIIGGALRLFIWTLKPALIAYGLFRAAEDCHEGRCPLSGTKSKQL